MPHSEHAERWTAQEPDGWPQDARAERIIGQWEIYQRSGGHRSSTDDVITAYFAAQRSIELGLGHNLRYLDLGCGVGSVLFMIAHRLRPQFAVGLEAQVQSVAMARRAVAALPCDAPPIRIMAGDFRTSPVAEQAFDLVTGSPPYFPVGTGSLPADPQRRACRFELRGGVEAYCEAARRTLAPSGRFYLVFQTTWDERVRAAAQAVGLSLTARLDVWMREDRAQAFLTVYEFQTAPAPRILRKLAIRDAHGNITPDYRQARAVLGLTTAP